MFFETFNNVLTDINVMSYWSALREFARSEIDDIDDQDASLTVSKDNPISSNSLTLSLTWDEEFEDQLLDREEASMLPTSRRVTVEEGDVHEDSPRIFNGLTDSIEFDGHIDSITLKESSMMVDYPFVVTYRLSQTGDITRLGADVLQELESLGSENSSDFSVSDVVECEVVYSDFDTNEVSSVDAYVRTDSPWEYLSDVESNEEIAEKIDDSESFRSSHHCIVPFSVNREELSDSRIKFYEDCMAGFVEESAKTRFSYTLEGESIYVRTGEVKDDDYCIAKPEFEYAEPDGDESVCFWIHADATRILGFNPLSSDSN